MSSSRWEISTSVRAVPTSPLDGFGRAVRVGGRVIVAGTAPIPLEGEDAAATAYEQMLRCGEIMLGSLGQAGAAAGDVVRTRMFITDPADADEIGRAHHQVFGEASPAATMVAVAGLLDSARRVEAEAEAQIRW